MIKTTDEYVLFLQGETNALRALVGALIDALPDKKAFAAALQHQRQQIEAAYARIPPPTLTRFRSEQVLDQWQDLLNKL
jgi:hypothetical protein